MLISAGWSTIGPRHRFERGPGFPHWTMGCSSWGVSTHLDAGERGAETSLNRLSLIPPGIPYRLSIDHARAFTTYWAIFDPLPRWLPWLRWPQNALGMPAATVRDRGEFADILSDFVHLVELHNGRGLRSRERALNRLEGLILRIDDGVTARTRSIDPRLERVLEVIEADLAAELRLSDLARIAGLSTSRFSHQFAKQVGQSPRRYLEGRRMSAARSLLQGTGLSIGDIASRVGFADLFHFSSRFRAVVGVSPSAYRARGA